MNANAEWDHAIVPPAEPPENSIWIVEEYDGGILVTLVPATEVLHATQEGYCGA